MSVATWAGVALLGGAGAVLRHVIDAAVMARTSRALPLGILAVNVSGALALGLLTGSGAGDEALLVAGTGLLGAYTTFSAWMLQAKVLVAEGRPWSAWAHVIVSLVLGFLAVAAGRGLA